MEISDYERELASAIVKVKNHLADAQIAMGVLESMLWLIRKENSAKKIETAGGPAITTEEVAK